MSSLVGVPLTVVADGDADLFAELMEAVESVAATGQFTGGAAVEGFERDYAAWCAEHDEDPEDARAAYAADRMAAGDVIPWPPARNEPCWCGSQHKYKKCCGPVPAGPMHEPET